MSPTATFCEKCGTTIAENQTEIEETRGGFSDTADANGVRRWAAQIVNAVKHGGDPDFLYEIWAEGNEAERALAEEIAAARI